MEREALTTTLPPPIPAIPDPLSEVEPDLTPVSPSDTRLQFGFHSGQVEMIKCTCRVCAVTAGQGGGKTSGGYWWLYGRMKIYPGESWLLGFPDFGLLTRVILNQPDPDRLTLVQFLAAMGEEPVLHIQERRISCKSGTIFFASGHDLVGWEGAHVKGAWLDEFDEMPLGAFRRALERTRMRQGQVLLTGTPRNVAWIKTEMTATPDLFHRVQFPSTANPSYPLSAMQEAQRILPPWEFRRIYLGELSDKDSGNMFRRGWWGTYEPGTLGTMIFTLQSWDTAFKEKTWNDFSVGATWGMNKTGYYLMDLWRDRAEYPKLKSALQSQYDLWVPSVVLVEDKASGQSLIQDIRFETRIPVISIKADIDKVRRAAAVTGIVASGIVHLPSYAPWLKEFLDEHEEFPDGAFDDQVDTTSQALIYLQKLSAGMSGGYGFGEEKGSGQSSVWSAGGQDVSEFETVGAGGGGGGVGDRNERAWN